MPGRYFFALTKLAGLDEIAALPGFEDATTDMVTAMLDLIANMRELDNKLADDSFRDNAINRVMRFAPHAKTNIYTWDVQRHKPRHCIKTISAQKVLH